MLPKYFIKDDAGAVINTIVADEEYISSVYQNYELAFVEELQADALEKATHEARAWRDKELARTDALIGLADYPHTDALIAYRQKLRDWPSEEGFPNIEKPRME